MHGYVNHNNMLVHLIKTPPLKISAVSVAMILAGVSYTLLFEQKRYFLWGYPDFIVHKDDIGAGRIHVATGEINNPAVQNSIYAVGSLLETQCSIVQLSVARPRPVEHEDEAGVGTVSAKYVASLSPLDLRTTKGIKNLAIRLNLQSLSCSYYSKISLAS